jgi:putative Holliday junction resolvase
VKVLALDYGRARTGVAVSDPTGTVARPLAVVERVTSRRGLDRLAEIVREEAPDLVVVGMPITLRGERGAQAVETDGFVRELRRLLDVPVDVFDERFTTRLAERTGGAAALADARAAAHLLSSYLQWASRPS